MAPRKENPRAAMIRVRVTKAEMARVKAKATAKGMDMSEYIRRRIGLGKK